MSESDPESSESESEFSDSCINCQKKTYVLFSTKNCLNCQKNIERDKELEHVKKMLKLERSFRTQYEEEEACDDCHTSCDLLFSFNKCVSGQIKKEKEDELEFWRKENNTLKNKLE